MSAILMKNINPIGFSPQILDSGMDMTINYDGIIETIGFGLEASGKAQIIDLSKYYLSPGWIDMHAHVYYQFSNLAVDPDSIGPTTGVTVLVDAGSSGGVNFAGFRDHIITKKSYPIFSFINLSTMGMVYVNHISELDSMEKVNLDHLVECVNENRDYIKGLKIRASGAIMRGMGGIEVVKLAKRTAVELELPLMIHVGEPLPMLEDILNLMESGDIVTHCFHGKKWGIFNKGKLIPEFIQAYERGVLFDVGHGSASFNFDVAEKAIALGYKPFSIGTDLHIDNIRGPVWDLSTTMSKMSSVGLSLEDIIRSVTANPASILGIESYQEELQGKRARFTVFSVDSKSIRVMDSNRNERVLNHIFCPIHSIIGTEVIDAALNYSLYS